MHLGLPLGRSLRGFCSGDGGILAEPQMEHGQMVHGFLL